MESAQSVERQYVYDSPSRLVTAKKGTTTTDHSVGRNVFAYDGYGRPYIRESAGRGDMDDNTQIVSGDATRFTDAKNGTIWDPRADMDDDGDVDSADQTLFDAKRPTWDPLDVEFGSGPTVAQAFSDVGNPYLFQGVPHFALDTAANATEGRLMLNHHRARYADPVTGRWGSRDPLFMEISIALARAAYAVEALGQRNHEPASGSSMTSAERANVLAEGNINQTYTYLKNCPTNLTDESGYYPAKAPPPPPETCSGGQWVAANIGGMTNGTIWYSSAFQYCAELWDWWDPRGWGCDCKRWQPKCTYIEIRIWTCTSTGAQTSTQDSATEDGFCRPYG